MTTNNNNNNGTKMVIFGGQSIPVPAELSIDEIKAGLVSMFPSIEGAIPHEDEFGNIRFLVEAGEKGSN